MHVATDMHLLLTPAYTTTKNIKPLVNVLIVTWNFKKVNKVKNDDKRISKPKFRVEYWIGKRGEKNDNSKHSNSHRGVDGISSSY
jgi:hypothetical protein